MKILVAVDRNPYSACAVHEVARLARNTLANVTLLGVVPRKNVKDDLSYEASRRWNPEHPLVKALRNYREKFLGYFADEDSPYANTEFGYELVEVKRGVWEQLCVCRSARKNLKVIMRQGSPVKEILAESQEEDTDLIVLGCNKETMCAWEERSKVPQKIVNEAACSVLVAKEENKVEKIICCLDHDKTSQQSLEMINQIVTLHRAALEIVGIIDGQGLRADVDRKMANIFKYYFERQIQPSIKLVPLSSLELFISEEARHGLMALWMGKKSILEKVFPPSKVNRLIRASASSVLMLR